MLLFDVQRQSFNSRERLLLFFCKTVFECEHYFIDAFRHLTISGILLPSCLCQWVVFFSPPQNEACLFWMLSWQELGSWSWQWMFLTPQRPNFASYSCMSFYKLSWQLRTVFLGGGGAPASISKGVEMILLLPEDNRNHFQLAQWDWREPEQPQAWASPWCCLEKPPGFAASQVGQETRGPSGFPFTSSCLLFWADTAERRFMESKPL